MHNEGVYVDKHEGIQHIFLHLCCQRNESKLVRLRPNDVRVTRLIRRASLTCWCHNGDIPIIIMIIWRQYQIMILFLFLTINWRYLSQNVIRNSRWANLKIKLILQIIQKLRRVFLCFHLLVCLPVSIKNN